LLLWRVEQNNVFQQTTKEKPMNLAQLKKAGICFDFCPDAVVPEIPKVQDVLFAMRLVETDESYIFARDNHSTYVVNVGLVIAAVGHKVLGIRWDEEITRRQVIAKAIVELCPSEARCLFNSAYVDAKRIAGEAIPMPEKPGRDTLLEACECNSCVNLRFKESQGL